MAKRTNKPEYVLLRHKVPSLSVVRYIISKFLFVHRFLILFPDFEYIQFTHSNRLISFCKDQARCSNGHHQEQIHIA